MLSCGLLKHTLDRKKTTTETRLWSNLKLPLLVSSRQGSADEEKVYSRWERRSVCWRCCLLETRTQCHPIPVAGTQARSWHDKRILLQSPTSCFYWSYKGAPQHGWRTTPDHVHAAVVCRYKFSYYVISSARELYKFGLPHHTTCTQAASIAHASKVEKSTYGRWQKVLTNLSLIVSLQLGRLLVTNSVAKADSIQKSGYVRLTRTCKVKVHPQNQILETKV